MRIFGQQRANDRIPAILVFTCHARNCRIGGCLSCGGRWIAHKHRLLAATGQGRAMGALRHVFLSQVLHWRDFTMVLTSKSDIFHLFETHTCEQRAAPALYTLRPLLTFFSQHFGRRVCDWLDETGPGSSESRSLSPNTHTLSFNRAGRQT